jgi:hypothetical protein
MPGSKDLYDFVVVLRNNHKRSIEKTGWLLSILLLILLGFSILTELSSLMLIIVSFITIALMTSNYFEKRKKKDLSFKPILIAGGIGLIVASSLPFIIGSLLILCGLFEKTILQKREFGFSNNIIQENGLFGKKIRWNELNRVVLKDDLLTIDFKNNKIFQAYTDDEDDDEYEVGADEFNAYCQNRIDQA